MVSERLWEFAWHLGWGDVLFVFGFVYIMKVLSYKIDIIIFIIFKIHEGQMSHVVYMLFDSDELDLIGLSWKKKHSKPQSKTTRATWMDIEVSN